VNYLEQINKQGGGGNYVYKCSFFKNWMLKATAWIPVVRSSNPIILRIHVSNNKTKEIHPGEWAVLSIETLQKVFPRLFVQEICLPGSSHPYHHVMKTCPSLIGPRGIT
jgi:hypothetical protein